ncbi:MAG: NADH-dependent [FeFe] hydrogenase, group A6 [Erysipelotrichaceae bacterium]|nr:NADH-dependent [FeFe] hydrogenase, group A6 [Erysipelotrichaceae bacterium]
MALVNIKIEGKSYQVEDSLTVLEACRKCGYNIPSLCSFMDGRCSLASCRVCLVEVKGARGLVASCAYPVNEGMEISISSPKATAARRTSVELLLSNHQKNCLQCEKNGKCELLEVSKMVGARNGKYLGVQTKATLDEVAPGLVRNTGKCILCGRCIETCKQLQGIGILGFENRGFKTIVSPAQNRSFADSPCMQCGQCVLVCPTGALMEHSEIDKVDQAFKDGKFVVCQVAPAVRAAIAEEFGEKIGTNGTGKMIAALHRLGFNRVFDVNFGADLTIMEEGNELIHRIKNGGVLPQITSCSPGWINYMEYYYSDIIPHISTCKSPHTMQGAITKSYFAETHNIDPKDIYVVSIMPCTAKKYEKSRKEMEVNGVRDVDAVLTTREIARMIKRVGINWNKLPEDEQFDQDLLGQYSGAGVIFGVTGGVMEAALRTAYNVLTGKEYGPIVFDNVRGLAGVREASVDVDGTILKVAIASGMANAKILLDEVRNGTSPYAFIEIMGCPGGCINGGGQPYVKPIFLPNEDDNILETYKQKRASVLYSEDERQVVRQSHNNPDIIALYKNYLGHPLSERAEELLHTHYEAHRERFPNKK